MYSLYHPVAELATPAGRPLTAIFPSHGQAGHLHGSARVRGGRRRGRVTLTGDIAGTLVTDAAGRLERLELPGQGTVVHAARVAALLKSLPHIVSSRFVAT